MVTIFQVKKPRPRDIEQSAWDHTAIFCMAGTNAKTSQLWKRTLDPNKRKKRGRGSDYKNFLPILQNSFQPDLNIWPLYISSVLTKVLAKSFYKTNLSISAIIFLFFSFSCVVCGFPLVHSWVKVSMLDFAIKIYSLKWVVVLNLEGQALHQKYNKSCGLYFKEIHTCVGTYTYMHRRKVLTSNFKGFLGLSGLRGSQVLTTYQTLSPFIFTTRLWAISIMPFLQMKD